MIWFKSGDTSPVERIASMWFQYHLNIESDFAFIKKNQRMRIEESNRVSDGGNLATPAAFTRMLEVNELFHGADGQCQSDAQDSRLTKKSFREARAG